MIDKQESHTLVYVEWEAHVNFVTTFVTYLNVKFWANVTIESVEVVQVVLDGHASDPVPVVSGVP